MDVAGGDALAAYCSVAAGDDVAVVGWYDDDVVAVVLGCYAT